MPFSPRKIYRCDNLELTARGLIALACATDPAFSALLMKSTCRAAAILRDAGHKVGDIEELTQECASYMRDLRRDNPTLNMTELAEDTAFEFESDHWLDEETHWIWDIAANLHK